eukprot:gb/GECG01008388.1/.p1 GENE.gb/GECG01008388.1/~~gb/GECG01008388.1/.p1  ORF type:complete len:735 (+),score=87.48 gb/GECG01008388.1/:1-2205(+)
MDGRKTTSTRGRPSPKSFMQGLKNTLGLVPGPPAAKRHRAAESHPPQNVKQSKTHTAAKGTGGSEPMAASVEMNTQQRRTRSTTTPAAIATSKSTGAIQDVESSATRNNYNSGTSRNYDNAEESDLTVDEVDNDYGEDAGIDDRREADTEMTSISSSGNQHHRHKTDDVTVKQETIRFKDLSVYIVPDGKKVTKVQRKIWAEQLERLGATVPNHLTTDLTHIVVDNSLDMERIRGFFRKQRSDYSDMDAYVVTAEWIVCSLTDRKPAMVEPFILEGFSLHPSTKEEPIKADITETSRSESEVVISPNKDKKATSEHTQEKRKSIQTKTDPHKIEIPDKMLDVRNSFACVRSGDASLRRQQKNDDIVTKIEECADILGASADIQNIWREYQYKKAASMIRNLPYRVDAGNVNTLLKKKGIGQRMVEKVKEILQKGTFRKLEILKTQSSTKTMQDLTAIWGVGPKTAQKIAGKGIKSAADLREHIGLPELSSYVDPAYIKQTLQFSDTQLEKARELGVTTRGLQGLCFYQDLLQRIPREEVGEIEREIRCAAAKLWDGVTAICCGSYRRGKRSSGDVDVIVTHDDGNFRHLSGLIQMLEKLGMLNGDWPSYLPQMGCAASCLDWSTQMSEVTALQAQRLPDFSYSQICRQSGSDHFNRSMRAYAKRCGLTLTDSGLHACERFKGEKWWTGNTLICHSEKEIFDALRLPYKTPEERNCYNEDVLDHDDAEDDGDSPL